MKTAKAVAAEIPAAWKAIQRLEDAIYRVAALSDLVIGKTTTLIDEDSRHQARVICGLIGMEASAINELEDAFNHVASHVRKNRA